MAKKSKSSSNFASALLYIVLGVLLVVFRSQTLDWAMTIAGVFFILSGVIDLLRKNGGSGVVSIIIGIAVLVLGWTVTQIVLLVLGILIAVKGVLALLAAIANKWTLFGILFPILTIAVGLVLAFGNGLDQILVVAGVLLVVDGVLGLFGSGKK